MSFVFRFEDIEVRENDYAFTRAEATVKVEPTAFRVLLYLLRNPGRLVTKDEIMAAVWHDTAVSDNSLTRSVATLRRVLDDNSREPRYIATVQTLGYRFLVPVEKQPLAPTPESAFAGVVAASPDTKATPDQNKAENVAREMARPPGQAARRSTSRWLIPASAGLVLALVSAGFLLMVNRRTDSKASSANPSFEKSPEAVVSLPGAIYSPALSPDGKQIAFVWMSEAHPREDLYVQLIGGDQPLRLTHNPSGFIRNVSWSPDGRQIAYGHCDDDGGAVFVISALGIGERKLTETVCAMNNMGWPQWTADGKALLLADRCAPGGPAGIVLFSLLTGEKKCLTSPPPGGNAGDVAPTLSPDHKTVAFYRTTTLGRDEVYTVDLSGKNLRQLTHSGYGVWGPLMWTVDGKYVVFNHSGPDIRGPSRVPVEGGPIEAASAYPAVGSLSRDGRRLAYVDEAGSTFTWRAELAGAGGKVFSNTKITLTALWEDSPQVTSDGQQVLVRTSRGQNGGGIWRTDIDGQNAVQLTDTHGAGFVGSPRWSPDTRWIAMDYRPGNHSQIYLVDSEGRNFHALTTHDSENQVPGWSRDGRSVYFSSDRTGQWQIWRRDLASGRESQVTQNGGIAPFESYDGTTLYYAKFDGGGIWRCPVSGGPEERVTSAPHRGYWGAYAITEAGIYFLDADVSPRPTIFYYDIETRRTTPVLSLDHLPYAGSPTLTASRDGRILLFTQWEVISHINLAEASL